MARGVPTAIANNKALRQTQDYGVYVLAWLSWFMSAAGGAGLAGTFVGGMIANALGWLPAWVSALALFVGVVSMLLDMFLDMIPNRLALACAALLPSLARAVPGRLGDEVTHFAGIFRSHLDSWTADWLGPAPAIGLALFGIIGSQLMARRVIAKGG
jgi:hypothetical protein